MKMLASDFDSTLYQNLTISEQDLAKIKEWQALGHQFGIVTGRDEMHLKIALSDYDIKLNFLITNNGACIHYNDKSASKTITAQTTHRLLTFLEQYQCYNVIVYDGHKRILVEYEQPSQIHYHEKIKYSTSLLFNQMIQCSINVGNIESAKLIEEEINHQFSDLIAYRNQAGVDIIAKGYSKATGIKTIYEKLQCNEIYVIGDSKNDIPMIEEFSGFCVANAETEVKDKAKHIFQSVCDCIDYLLIVR